MTAVVFVLLVAVLAATVVYGRRQARAAAEQAIVDELARWRFRPEHGEADALARWEP